MSRLLPRHETTIGLAILLTLGLLFTGAWWVSENHARRMIHSRTQITADQVAIRLEQFIDARMQIAESIRGDLAAGQHATPEAFVSRAEALMKAFPGLQAINWIDAEGTIRWIAPLDSNQAALGRNLLTESPAGPTLALAMDSGTVHVTPSVPLLQGGVGFAAYFPVPAGDASPGGVINLVGRIETLIEQSLATGVGSEFMFAVDEPEGRLYQSTETQDVASSEYHATAAVRVGNRSWRLTLAPHDATVIASKAIGNEIGLLLGLVLAGGLSVAVRGLLISRARLRDHDTRMIAMADNLPGVTFTFRTTADGQREVQHVSDGLERVLGPQTYQQVRSEFRFDEIVHPDDQAARQQMIRNCQEHPGAWDLEYRVRTDSGYKWIHSIARGEQLADGTSLWNGLLLDIDERKRASEALLRSEERQSAIMRHSPDYILLLDLDGTIEFMSNTIPELNAAELVGTPLIDHIPENQKQQFRDMLKTVAETQSEQRQELTVQVGDGPERILEAITGPVIEDGRVVSFVRMTRDVTEQRRATQRIWEQEQFLEQAAAVGHIGSWSAQIPDRAGAITWSDECYRIFGVQPEQFDGRIESFVALIHPDDRAAVQAANEQALQNNTLYAVDHRIIRPDGSIRWIHEQGRPILDDADRPIGMIGICQDITERRQTQEALQLVSEVVSSQVGQSFFEELTRTLAQVLGTKYAIVGRLSPTQPDTVETLAVWAGESFADNFSYALAGTPCAAVVSQDLCLHCSDVQQAYPDDAMLREMSISAYAGAPLVNSDGDVIGLLIVLDTKPFENEVLIQSLIRLMGTRAAGELEREHHLQLLGKSDERYRAFIAGSSEAVWRIAMVPPVDTSLPPAEQARTIYQNSVMAECNDVCAQTYGAAHARDIEGRRFRELMPELDDEFRAFLEGFIRNNHRLIEQESREVDAGETERFLINNCHGVIEAGKLVHIWGTHRDVTEKKAIEQRQRLMMRELDHRVKNNLAAVLSLAQQSIRESDSFEQFGTAFTGRIAAMARTHEALASTKWKGVHLRSVIATSLAPFVTAQQLRDWISGPDVTLPARAAMPVCLTLHELATNASKYGSLRETQGRLNISWTIEDDRVVLTWREESVSNIDQPTGEGLGIRLIRGLIAHELAGAVHHEFDEQGLLCELVIPLSEPRASTARTVEPARSVASS